MVQPIFESLVVFAWCVVSAIAPAPATPEASREEVAAEAIKSIEWDLATAVEHRDCARFLSRLSPELREKIGDHVTAVFAEQKRHALGVNWKYELVSASSYEAVYKVKILTTSRCHTGYRPNIEYATVVISPGSGVDEDAEQRFNSAPRSPDHPKSWQVTKWETEKVVPYDESKDR